MRQLTSFSLLVLCGTHLAPQEPAPTLEATLRDAAEATGIAQLDDIIRVHGASLVLDTDAEFTLTFDARGRYRRKVVGTLASEVVWDGESLWETRHGTGPYTIELSLRELELVRAWVHTGFWASPNAPLVVERLDTTSEQTVGLSLRLQDGRLESTLLLDPVTWLPRTLFQEDGAIRVDYEAFEELNGITLPRATVGRLGPGREVIDELAAVERIEKASFECPADPGTTSFDREASPFARLRRTPSGHLLVKALVDDRDVGWFLFDTGAGFTGISAEVADELGLPSFGQSALSGVGGPTGPRAMRRASSLRIGPLTIREPTFTESGMGTRLGLFDGRPIAGVVGFDVLARSIAELDLDTPTLALHDPAEYELPSGEWTDLVVHYRVPYVRASFEGDRAGLFMLDTGAGDRDIVFFAHATAALDLLAGRDTTSTTAQGAGGTVQARVGELAWIRVAGRNFDNPVATFFLGEDGESDPYSYGLIGGGLLAPFRIVLDYANRRAAFLAD